MLPRSYPLATLLGPQDWQEIQGWIFRQTGVFLQLFSAQGHPLTAPGSQPRRSVAPAVIHPEFSQTVLEAADNLTISNIPVTANGKYLGWWILEPVYVSASDISKPFWESSIPRVSARQLSALLTAVETLSQAIIELELQTRYLYDQLDTAVNGLRYCMRPTSPGIVLSDAAGRILFANSRYCCQVGAPMDQIFGRHTAVHSSRNGLCGPQSLGAEGPAVWYGYHDDVSGKWMRCADQRIPWMDRTLCLSMQWDITQEHMLRQELNHTMLLDPQTALPNRAKLEQDLQRPDMEQGSGTILGYRITSLPEINHLYGRKAGDVLLLSVARWICRNLRGMLYRVSGNCFCLHVPGNVPADIPAYTEALWARLEQPWSLSLDGEDLICMPDASVAVLTAPPPDEFQTLLDRMEWTLEVSRNEHRPIIYEADADAARVDRYRLRTALKQCVAQNMLGFDVVYQPIVHIESGSWIGIEALCRWERPGHGPVQPPQFIAEAENLGLIRKIGHWVLEQSVRLCKELRLDTMPGFFLSVNISPLEIDRGFGEGVCEILQHHNYPGSKLNLEITETQPIRCGPGAQDAIALLRNLGVTLTLDDFGKGYSTLESLSSLPLAYIKTDRDFTLSLAENRATQDLYRTLSEFFRTNGIRVIAEGVETDTQLRLVSDGGADLVQGFFFSEPVRSSVLRDRCHQFAGDDAGHPTPDPPPR